MEDDRYTKDVWVNRRTGEEITAAKVLKRLARDDFEITYIAYLMDVFDKLGGKNMQFLNIL